MAAFETFWFVFATSLIGSILTRGTFLPRSLEWSLAILCTVRYLLKMAAAVWGFHVCIFLLISPLNGQFPKKEKYYAIKEDLPYIRCETCQKAVKYLYGKTQGMRDGVTKRVSHCHY